MYRAGVWTDWKQIEQREDVHRSIEHTGLMHEGLVWKTIIL